MVILADSLGLKNSKYKISILLAAYKSEHLLEKVFLASVFKNTSVPVEVIIYDNGGNNRKEPDYEYLIRDIPIHVKTIGNGENIGLNRALNECAKEASGEYFYLPHTDMYLLPGWDTSLLKECRNLAPATFLFCSRSIEPTKGHTNHHVIRNFGKEWNEFKEEDLLVFFSEYKDKGVEVGARMPFFMHRKLWHKMNGVDPVLHSYCTDDDLVQNAFDCGVRRFWLVQASVNYHLQGKSNNQQKVDKDSNWPYEYFVDKWKKKYPNVTHPGQYHPKIIPFYNKIK